MLAAFPALETSPDDFVARFAAYAAHGELLPQPEGSPLMEFVCTGQVLYLFDRTGPYTAQPGPAWVVIHGVLQDLEVLEGGPPELHSPTELHSPDVSQLQGVGQVVALESRRTVVVATGEADAPLPLVLSSFGPLPALQVGDWLAFVTEKPLHGFLVKAND